MKEPHPIDILASELLGEPLDGVAIEHLADRELGEQARRRHAARNRLGGRDPPPDRRRGDAAQLADRARQLAALEGLPMTILYLILPLALLLAGGAVAAFVWTVRSGQLDDVDTPPRRILFDDPVSPAAPGHGLSGASGSRTATVMLHPPPHAGHIPHRPRRG
jgi:cbb3-type cytochrome oxidase maturation protein